METRHNATMRTMRYFSWDMRLLARKEGGAEKPITLAVS
jgi:hypothetical protein